ncbi:hypothetical protein [Methanogenium sp. MK-MG]|uniref:hypothetical protein n=1 Tax=Methanogenium sp. MK-MG TaxID=2599926 RepID=UPI0013EC166A|nr:hypothetical protein [Methanogenium sp. MK-MG]KAF1078164.1 hypothetical protein MKMG_00904 [Methanogenium sp. MK-MG]
MVLESEKNVETFCEKIRSDAELTPEDKMLYQLLVFVKNRISVPQTEDYFSGIYTLEEYNRCVQKSIENSYIERKYALESKLEPKIYMPNPEKDDDIDKMLKKYSLSD